PCGSARGGHTSLRADWDRLSLPLPLLSRPYRNAPPVKPAMNRSRNVLSRSARGMLGMSEATMVAAHCGRAPRIRSVSAAVEGGGRADAEVDVREQTNTTTSLQDRKIA